MHSATIGILRSSFARIASHKVDVASIFYERLFEVAPSVRPLFKADLRDQQQKLMIALVYVVQAVDDPQRLIGTLTTLGERHVAYGAKPEHYDVVGDTLLWTFEEILGDEFTPEVRDAWAAAYNLVANTMRAGAAAATTPVHVAPLMDSPQPAA